MDPQLPRSRETPKKKMDDYLCHGSGDAHHHSYAEYFIKFINLHQFFFKGIGEQESSLN